MRINQVLEKVPGLTRHELNFMEKAGYISAQKIRRQERTFREYHDIEVEKIRIIQRLKNQGLPLKEAAKNAERELKRLVSHTIPLALWALHYQESTVGEIMKRVHDAQRELEEMGVLYSPSVEEKNSWRKQLEHMIEKSYPKFNQEILYFAAKTMLDRFNSNLQNADLFLTISPTGSLLAGAISSLAYQIREEPFCPIIPWDENLQIEIGKAIKRRQKLLIIEGVARDSDRLVKVCELLRKFGCKVEILAFLSLLSEKEKGEIERKQGCQVKSLFMKDRILGYSYDERDE